jgi:hypothetical protein
MREGLDEQGRRGVWPNPVDTPLDRARRVAGMYRARLRALDRDACDDCDAAAVGFGETWMLEKLDVVDPDAELTTAQAARMVSVSVRRIREWAQATHPEDRSKPLLPRFKMRGRERTYLAQHVLAAAAAMRRYQHTNSASFPT